jgi:precorrin-2 dehydrogenase/sirohydrochlorin ferrochelatase
VRYFPVFLNLKGKLCVVVGGGRVGERKVRSLLKAGALVKVIGPELTPSLFRLRKKRKITHFSRSYHRGDLGGAFLVIAATDDRTTNERVFRQARERRVLVNVVDDPAHSSFIVPSIVEKKDLIVAISTSGRSPAMARVLRQKLEKEIGPEYNLLLKFLEILRKKILRLGWGQKENQKIFRALVKEDLLSLIKEKKFPELNRRLKTILGPGFSLKELGLRW